MKSVILFFLTFSEGYLCASYFSTIFLDQLLQVSVQVHEQSLFLLLVKSLALSLSARFGRFAIWLIINFVS
jgi:hypothetical protein